MPPAAWTDGRGLATLDYDNDGDQDVITVVYGGNYNVYENTVDQSTTSLQMRVVDADGVYVLAVVERETDRVLRWRSSIPDPST